jgi:6-phosphofructokinase
MLGGSSGWLTLSAALVGGEVAVTRSQEESPHWKVICTVYRRRRLLSKEESVGVLPKQKLSSPVNSEVSDMVNNRASISQREDSMIEPAADIRTSVRRFCCRTFFPLPVMSI